MTDQPQLIARDLPGYEPQVAEALWRLQDARERTVELLGKVSADVVDRQVDGNSIGTILAHMALIEADWLFVEILEEPIAADIHAVLPETDRDQAGILTMVIGQSLQQHLERLELVRTRLLDRLKGMTDDEFNRARSLPDYDVSPAWVLHHLAQHDAEHRAELGALIG